IGVALAEMAFAGDLGANVHLGKVPLGEPINRDDFILFSESNSRFLAEVDPANQAEFEKIMAGTPLAVIGSITESDALTIQGTRGNTIIDVPLAKLKEAWQRPIRW
ncbi:MAG: AIR synthase-related protein, partial [Dehalococcoidales bacterium]|nr:AIR synthase-related protein [Dehalococcoidales bacterium]